MPTERNVRFPFEIGTPPPMNFLTVIAAIFGVVLPLMFILYLLFFQ